MELSKAQPGSWYTIREVGPENQDLESRLLAHGFVPGEKIMVKRYAPIFKDPILVQLGHSQLALTKSEANSIRLLQLD